MSQATDQPEQQAASRAVVYVGLLSDVSLTCIKGAAGLLTGSAALLSDSVHSAADMLLSAVTMVATRIASTAPDGDHPYGHGRFDSLGALTVAALLTATGVSIGIRGLDSIAAVLSGAPVAPMLPLLEHVPIDALSDPTLAGGAMLACLASVAIKEGVYRWTMRVGMQLRSQALIANAWHHRADSASSLVAAVGVGGAFAGLPVLDPLAAVAVAGMITKAGLEIGYRSVQELMDEALDEDVLQLASGLARAHASVVGVQRVRARRMGPSVHIDMEVALRSHETVAFANGVAEDIRSAVFQKRPEVAECLVTIITEDRLVNSASASSLTPSVSPAVSAHIRGLLQRVPGVKAVSSCEVHDAAPGVLHVDAQVVLDMRSSLADASTLLRAAEAQLHKAQVETVGEPAWRIGTAHVGVDMKPL